MASKIKIVAVRPAYEEKPVFAPPFFDAARREFIVGNEKFPARREDDPRNTKQKIFIHIGEGFELSETGSYSLSHGELFDPNNKWDMLKLQMGKDRGFVAESMAAVNPMSDVRFYVENAEVTAKKQSEKKTKVKQALALLETLTLADKRDFAFVMRQTVRDMTEAQIEGYLDQVAMEQPQLLLDKAGTTDDHRRTFKLKAFVAKLVAHNLLTIEGGQYKDGPNLIGIDEAHALEFMKVDKNRTWVENKKKDLKGLMSAGEEPLTTVTDKTDA